MGDKSKELKKLINNKKLKIATIILLAVTIISAVIFFILNSKDITTDKEAIDSSKSNDFVYFDIHMLTDCIATCTTDSRVEKYYIATNDEYMMLLEISDSKYKELKDIVDYTYGDTDVKPQPYRIMGTTYSIPSELKEITLEYYQEMFPDSDITEHNFSDYFGEHYVDTTVTPNTSSVPLLLVLSFMTGTIFLVCVIVLIINVSKTNDTIKALQKNNELDTVYDEINVGETTKLEMQNVILTANYLVDISNYLTVVKLKDIVWMYEFTYRRNGVETQRYVRIMDRYRKFHIAASKNSLGRNYNLFKETFMKIAERCPNALLGYTSENIKATQKKNFENTLNDIDMKNASMK